MTLRAIVAIGFCWLLAALGLISLGLRYQNAIGSGAMQGSSALQMTALWTLIAIGSFFLLRYLAPRADLLLLIIPLSLTGLGVVFIYRLDLQKKEVASVLNTIQPQSLALTQLLWLVVGVVGALLLIRFLPLNFLSRYPMLIGAIAVVLLLMPILPFGAEVNGAQLWVRVGEVQFQPGEFGKVFFAIFLGVYLARFDLYRSFDYVKSFGVRMPPLRQLGPALVTVLVCGAILVVQRDLGTALLLLLLFGTVVTVATGRLTVIASIGAVILIGSFVSVNLFSHVARRVEAWLDPFSSPNDVGYQILQSIFGLASGGIFGEGLGSGSPNLIPFASTDFIIAVAGEEIGYAGLLAILTLLAVFIGRAFRLGVSLKRPTSQLIVVSLASLIGIQTLLVLGGIVRLIPLTGLTTPFLSYGGSSLIASWLVVGLLLKFSNELNTPQFPSTDVLSDETMVIRR